jgi:crotonobetainyl-CoA:carnitine CoA-transferase CaiB-like acyl-CoA transferase
MTSGDHMSAASDPVPLAEPLRGVRVLDVTTFLAGPLLTRNLADLGAEVIKVESPTGDPTRPPPGSNFSPLWLNVHRGRRSVVLDLKTDAGGDVFRALAARADVLAENFRPGVSERLGIGADVLCADNPRLIHASITGFGAGGPLGDQIAIDGAVQAFAGSVELSERNGLDPSPAPIPVADLAGASTATQAVLAALYARQRSGRGCRIDVSLLEAFLPWVVINRQASVAPPITQIVVGSDGGRFLVQAPIHFHHRLMLLMAQVPGCEAALTDTRFADRDGARAHAVEYTQLLRTAFKSATRAEWLQRLAAAGIPAAPVHLVDEALAHPQLEFRGAVAEVVNIDETHERILLSPYRFDGQRRDVVEAPPRLGHDTLDVMANVLGHSDPEIQRLAARGAFGDLEV